MSYVPYRTSDGVYMFTANATTCNGMKDEGDRREGDTERAG